MTTPKEAHLWRREIQHGPEGEAKYAWVYDADGVMVCTARIHHAEAIVTRMNATASLQGEEAVERVAGCICQNQHRRGYCTEPGCPYSTSDAVEKVKALAHRFWSIHPSTIAAMNLTREEFYVREMMALLATGLVPDEAAIRADEREKCETGAIHDIAAERKRQREVEGWMLEHDDGHDRGELAAAAACYAVGRCIVEGSVRISERRLTKNLWPWSLKWWKPKGRRRNLVRAATLIVAEIERIDRAAAIRSNQAKS